MYKKALGLLVYCSIYYTIVCRWWGMCPYQVTKLMFWPKDLRELCLNRISPDGKIWKKKLSNLKCWSFQLLKFKVGKISWFGVFTGTLLDVTMQQRIKCEFNWSFKPFHESSIDILLPGVTFDTTLCDINNIFKFVNRYICLI